MARAYPYNLLHAMKLMRNTQHYEILIRCLNNSKLEQDALLRTYRELNTKEK
jgi:hypothetical protein